MASGLPDYTTSTDIESQSVDRLSTITKAPDGTTPILKSVVAVQEEKIIHTVSVDKTFYLTTFSLACSSLDTNAYGYIAVRDDVDILQYYIFRQYLWASAGIPVHVAHGTVIIPPFELPEGWDVVVSSGAANFTSAATISGWEE